MVRNRTNTKTRKINLLRTRQHLLQPQDYYKYRDSLLTFLVKCDKAPAILNLGASI